MQRLKEIVKHILPGWLGKMCKRLYSRWCYLKVCGKFKGDKVYCPCCNRKFSGFQTFTFDPKYRNPDFFKENLDVVCPYCRSFPRHRIACNYLDKNNILPKNSISFHFAVPYAYELWFKRNNRKFISGDLFDKTADMKVDILDTPFEDNKFDMISCDHVLEHVPNYRSAVKELYRITKPGGYTFITVPLLESLSTTYEDETVTTVEQRVKTFGQYDHVRIFGMDFSGAMSDVGFEVIVYDGDTCNEKIRPVIGPGNYDYNKAFVCKKPL